MIYCSAEDYELFGGNTDDQAWYRWVEMASCKIDRMTHGRAERYAQQLRRELSAACARIAILMAKAYAVRSHGAGLSSASNDGYSESYADPIQTDQALERACYAALADALGSDRYGLLYAGVM